MFVKRSFSKNDDLIVTSLLNIVYPNFHLKIILRNFLKFFAENVNDIFSNLIDIFKRILRFRQNGNSMKKVTKYQKTVKTGPRHLA